MADGRLRNAARIAGVFHLDPVAVLRDGDRFTRAVRVAANNVVVEDENRRNKAATPPPGRRH